MSITREFRTDLPNDLGTGMENLANNPDKSFQ